jgi:hypothetical protein
MASILAAWYGESRMTAGAARVLITEDLLDHYSSGSLRVKLLSTFFDIANAELPSLKSDRGVDGNSEASDRSLTWCSDGPRRSVLSLAPMVIGCCSVGAVRTFGSSTSSPGLGRLSCRKFWGI